MKPRLTQVRFALLAVAFAGLVGCAAQKLNTEGMKLIESGQREQGLQKLAEASQLEPTNSRYRVDFLNQQAVAVRDLLSKADDARNAGKLDEARDLYLATVRLQPANDRAQRGLAGVELDRRQAVLLTEIGRMVKGGDLSGARSRLKQILLENPANRDAQKMLVEVQQQIDRAERTGWSPPNYCDTHDPGLLF